MPDDIENDILEYANDEADEQMNASDFDRNISTEEGAPSFFDLTRRIERGKIILNPDFQRNYVWDHKKESQLIESILLKLPLPMIYFAEMADGKKVVIDGQQRLTAISRFMHNEYVLKKLNVFKQLASLKI